MCVFKYHAFIYFLRPPPWSGTSTKQDKYRVALIRSFVCCNMPIRNRLYYWCSCWSCFNRIRVIARNNIVFCLFFNSITPMNAQKSSNLWKMFVSVFQSCTIMPQCEWRQCRLISYVRMIYSSYKPIYIRLSM